MIHPEFMYYVHQTWLGKRGHYASAGVFAIIWAVHICDEVCLLVRHLWGALHYMLLDFRLMCLDLGVIAMATGITTITELRTHGRILSG